MAAWLTRSEGCCSEYCRIAVQRKSRVYCCFKKEQGQSCVPCLLSEEGNDGAQQEAEEKPRVRFTWPDGLDVRSLNMSIGGRNPVSNTQKHFCITATT